MLVYQELSSGRGGLPYERVGMLVISLRGVNFRFWSRLGCSEQNATKFSCQVSFRVARKEIYKIYVFNLFYLLFYWSKKGWATPSLAYLGGLIQNFQQASPPLSYGPPRELSPQGIIIYDCTVYMKYLQLISCTG